MEDSFGKIVGFLLAAVLMFIVPMRISLAESRATTTLGMYSEVSRISEQISNTGYIDQSMYMELCHIVSSSMNNYSIRISAEGKDDYISSEDIKAGLEAGKKIKLPYGAYMKIAIYEGKRIRISCGGMIKAYENN